MTLMIEETSTLTGKGQTTVPKAVRQSLGLRPGDQIAYHVDDSGAVSLSRVGDEQAAVDAFLEFLSADIKRHPQTVRLMDVDAVSHARELVGGVDVDLEDDFAGATPI